MSAGIAIGLLLGAMIGAVVVALFMRRTPEETEILLRHYEQDQAQLPGDDEAGR